MRVSSHLTGGTLPRTLPRSWAVERKISWSPPPKKPILRSDEVHVWRAILNLEPPSVRTLRDSLSQDERARAERFHFRGDGERFIVARGLLRRILADYLDTGPDQLRFSYNPHGKPAVSSEPGRYGLHFNLSHSYGLGLYAVTRDRDIGIDIERIRKDASADWIAERFFSPAEVARLRALSPKIQPEAFFACWTRKEAYVKARGLGLSLPLDRFEVLLDRREPAPLLNIREDPAEISRWSVQELIPGPGYVAAVAVEGQCWQLKCWDSPAVQCLS